MQRTLKRELKVPEIACGEGFERAAPSVLSAALVLDILGLVGLVLRLSVASGIRWFTRAWWSARLTKGLEWSQSGNYGLAFGLCCWTKAGADSFLVSLMLRYQASAFLAATGFSECIGALAQATVPMQWCVH